MYSYSKKIIPYLFILPALLLFGVFFFLPLCYVIILSFKSYASDIYNPSWVGLNNYITLFHTKEFYQTLGNTFLFMLYVVPTLVILPLFLGILLNNEIKFKNLYKLLIYFPVIVSIVVAAISFKWLYAENGLMNYFLNLLNFKSIDWLTSTDFSLISIAILTIWKGIGYYMLIYLAALIGVPKELYEASEIDGAGFWQKHLTITIPHIMPTIFLVMTISSISAIKTFVEIYVMTKGGPLNSSKTIVYYIYERAFENLDLGIASAASVVLLVLVMTLSILNVKFFDKERYKI